MGARWGRILAGRKGQSAVELALILPVLVLLLVGLLQVGVIMEDYLQLQTATEEGARAAILGKSDSQIQQAVDQSAPRLTPSQLTVTVSPSASQRTPGSEVTVSTQYPITIAIPLLQSLIGQTVNLTSQVTMRME